MVEHLYARVKNNEAASLKHLQDSWDAALQAADLGAASLQQQLDRIMTPIEDKESQSAPCDSKVPGQSLLKTLPPERLLSQFCQCLDDLRRASEQASQEMLQDLDRSLRRSGGSGQCSLARALLSVPPTRGSFSWLPPSVQDHSQVNHFKDIQNL